MSDPKTNQRITDLTLSPRLLARLIRDTDLPGFFQDPEFTRLNPGAHVPVQRHLDPAHPGRGQRRHVDHDELDRVERCGVEVPRRAMIPTAIPVNAAFQNVAYPTDIFENRALDDAYLPRLGSGAGRVTRLLRCAAGRHLTTRSRPARGSSASSTCATARRFDLPIARDRQRARGRRSRRTTRASSPDTTRWSRVLTATQVADPASKDSTAYPLVKIDYAMVPTQPDDAHRVAIQDLLTWGVTAGQTDLPAGYLPLPDELVAQTKHVADSLSGTTDGPTGFAPDGSSFGSGDFGASAFDSGSPYAAPAGGASDATAAAAGTSPAKSAAERQARRYSRRAVSRAPAPVTSCPSCCCWRSPPRSPSAGVGHGRTSRCFDGLGPRQPTKERARRHDRRRGAAASRSNRSDPPEPERRAPRAPTRAPQRKTSRAPTSSGCSSKGW